MLLLLHILYAHVYYILIFILGCPLTHAPVLFLSDASINGHLTLSRLQQITSGNPRGTDGLPLLHVSASTCWRPPDTQTSWRTTQVAFGIRSLFFHTSLCVLFHCEYPAIIIVSQTLYKILSICNNCIPFECT